MNTEYAVKGTARSRHALPELCVRCGMAGGIIGGGLTAGTIGLVARGGVSAPPAPLFWSLFTLGTMAGFVVGAWIRRIRGQAGRPGSGPVKLVGQLVLTAGLAWSTSGALSASGLLVFIQPVVAFLVIGLLLSTSGWLVLRAAADVHHRLTGPGAVERLEP